MKRQHGSLSDAWFPLILASSVTGFLAFTFELVLPTAEEAEIYKYNCEKKNGFVFDSRETGRICLKKESIIINVY